MSAGPRRYDQTEYYVAFGVRESGCIGMSRADTEPVCIYGLVPAEEVNEFARQVQNGEIKAPLGTRPDVLEFRRVRDVADLFHFLGSEDSRVADLR